MQRIAKKITHWELWPFNVIYAPLIFLWAYYALKARAFWFFSNVNPTLNFSGLEGETKKEMYDQLPKEYYPETVYIKANEPFEAIETRLSHSHISYPCIAKPEVGMQGILVRKIKNVEELKEYHQHLALDYLVQRFVDLPLEFSIFHIRYPGSKKGVVTGFIQKEYLQVSGDGQSNLLTLIQHHPKAKYREDEMRRMHGDRLEMVLPKGEKFYLSFTGNHNRGAKFINLHHQIDEALCNVFDAISWQAQTFHFGRYDVKCTSIEDLKAGKNICILEYNGVGAEPNHIYDCGMTYLQALKEIAFHWKHLYKIGRINFKKGIPYWTFAAGTRELKKAGKIFALLRKAELEF